jgi:hypothetical protein
MRMRKSNSTRITNPLEVKGKTAKALALLSQNPGLPIEMAAQATGVRRDALKAAMAKQHALSHSRCPTCLRILRPMKARPLPIDPATNIPLLPPPLTYSQRTKAAMKASLRPSSRAARAERYRILVLKAAARAGFRQPRRRPPSVAFGRGVKARLPTGTDVAALL